MPFLDEIRRAEAALTETDTACSLFLEMDSGLASTFLKEHVPVMMLLAKTSDIPEGTTIGS